MTNATVVILAAGEGKRMNSSLPKVLHEIWGRPMLLYVLDAVKTLRPKKIVVVLGRARLEVKSVLEKGVKVAVQTKPRGTADAVKAALGEVTKSSEDVIVLCGDTPLITQATIRCFYEFHKRQNAACTVLSATLENPKGYGRIIRDKDHSVIRIVEEKDATFEEKAVREINAGIYCFKKDDLLNSLKEVGCNNKSGEYYLPDVLPWMLRRGRKVCVSMVETPDEILGVNSQMQLAHASGVIRLRVLERHMNSHVRILDPATTFIDSSVKIGVGTTIFPFTYIEKDVQIGEDCQVGPFCRLRSGTVLKRKVRVGNFTEVKNSSLGDGVNMRHVSYLGDTRVGFKVNIGAGCVVANFDGKTKNKTVIKDKAFIGCDSVLVAPVTVGKGAVVGAGSVVTKKHHVRDGAVVAGVPAREVRQAKKKR